MNDLRDKNGLTEAEYLKAYNPGDWKKPSLTADICIVAQKDGENRILLIRRGNHPCLGMWALPGGFSEEGERIEETAARELLEETGISMSADDLTLVGIYSKPGRDPRGWTVSAAYLAVVDPEKVKPIAADDADAVGWFTIIRKEDAILLKDHETELGEDRIAFDHYEIITDALQKLIYQRVMRLEI